MIKNTDYIDYPRKDLTIAAIATPVGTGGLGVVRVSGSDSISIAEKIFDPEKGEINKFRSHSAHLGTVHQNGSKLDKALIMLMRGPRSFTGEDTVELSCHGGQLVLRQVLSAAIKAGATSAQPGEFSMRAFFNGKIDLAQAEAIQQLICAENELSLNVAREQLEGKLSAQIKDIRRRIIDVAAEVEASIDFVEEDIDPAEEAILIEHLDGVMENISDLIESYHDGRRIVSGLNVVITGKPNVGKSSLMNAMLHQERAIVTPIAGTTRDVIKENVLLGGFSVNIIDTAGIRRPDNVIEEEGVKRTAAAAAEADLVLFMVDQSVALTDLDIEIYRQIKPKPHLIVINKIDLKAAVSESEVENRFSSAPMIKVSALEETNIEQLKKKITKYILGRDFTKSNYSIITSVRHKEALAEAARSVERARACLADKLSPEFTAIELRTALEALNRIIGEGVTEDILDAVFSKFCIGK